MTQKSIVPAARYGTSPARLRRMQNVATSTPAEFQWAYDAGAVTPVPGSTLRDPKFEGEAAWLWLNSTSGGNWTVTALGIGTMTFAGAGAYAYLKALTDNGVLEWRKLYSSGVT